MFRSLLETLPKIELHRHLEGSLRPATLLEIARHYELDLPTTSLEHLRPFIQLQSPQTHQDNFLQIFETLRRFYQSPEIIWRVAYEAVADAAAENIRYLELQFSPQALAHQRGFPLTAVTDWVIDGAQTAARDHQIDVGLMISLVRHNPLAQAKTVAEIAFDRFGQGIVGLNLAGDEAKYPPQPFKPLFAEAQRLGMGISVHAGEWTNGRSVRDAVELLHAQRIGHGVRILQDKTAVSLVRERGITLETCLISNLFTGVVERLDQHPLPHLAERGLKLTLNSDDPSIFNSNLADEYEAHFRFLGGDWAQLCQFLHNSVDAAFVSDAVRAKLRRQIEGAWEPVWQTIGQDGLVVDVP